MLKAGKQVPVATSMIKSNPAIPVYKGEETIENLFAVIYHIEIVYNKSDNEVKHQYVIVDYKNYSLSTEDREEVVALANKYCEENKIQKDENLTIKLLDDEVAENFIEKIFDNMKVVRGLITKN